MLLAQLVTEYVADLTDLMAGAARADELGQRFGKLSEGPNTLAASFTNAGIQINTMFDTVTSATDASSADMTTSITSVAESFDTVSAAMAEMSAMTQANAEEAGVSLNNLGATGEAAASELQGSIEQTAGGFAQLQDAISSLTSSVNSAVSEINSQIDSIGTNSAEVATRSESAFSGFSMGGMVNQIGITIFSLQNMANMADQAATALLGPSIQAESTQDSFSNLLGSTKAATDELHKLNNEAAQTQFHTQDIDNLGASLIAFKTPIQEVVPEIQSIGDALTAIGRGTPAEMQSVIDILGKMRIQGTLTQGDLTELGRHGIDAGSAIAQGLGISTASLQDMVKKGTLPASDAINALKTGIEQNPMLSGGMAKQAQTLGGQLSTLSSDFNQVMASALQPALPELEHDVSSLINTVSSPSFKAFAATLGHDVATGVRDVVTGAKDLVSTGQKVTAFFQQNQPALEGLKIGLIAVAGAIGGYLVGSFILALPAMGAFAVAAWVAITPLLPFIAIGAAVALAIYGIVLAVQHWGDISKWLQGEWSGVQGFFGNIWQGIQSFFGNVGNWFHDRFSDAKNGAQQGFSGVQDFFKNTGKNVQDGWTNAVHGIEDGNRWLYEHNYYYKAFADNLSKVTNDTGKTIQDDWKASTSFIGNKWNELGDAGSKTFHNISDMVEKNISDDVDHVESGLKKISGVFGGAWNKYIAAPVSGIFTNLSHSVSNGLDTAEHNFTSFWSNTLNMFGGWANDGLHWGQNIINAMGQGIENALGGLEKDLSNVGSSIASFLGFHSPSKKGEGMHLMEWPKNLIASYGAGLEAAIPSLQSSLDLVMRPVAASFSGQNLGSSGVRPTATSGSSSTNQQQRQSSAIPTQQDIYLIIDGQKFAKTTIRHIGPELAKELKVMLK